MTAVHSQSRPDVSFLIAAHNVAPYIATAVRSALEQERVAVEVIVVDDASTDGTADVVAQFAAADGRVVLVRQPANMGPAAARNAAIARARGTWLAVLDGDDFVLRGRSRHLIDLGEASGAAIVADNFERVDIAGQPTGRTMIPTSDVPYSFVVGIGTFIRANIAFDRARFRLGAIKPLLRAEFLRAHAIRYRDLPIGEDYHICLDCLTHGGRFVVSCESLYKYRVRNGSQSWRLKPGDVVRMLQAHRETGIEARFRGDAEIEQAARLYVRALEKSLAFLGIVDKAKSRKVVGAALSAIAQPFVWPFVVRFGTEAILNRVRRPA